MIDRVQGAAASPTAGTVADPARQAALKEAAKAFEAVFLRQMIGSMRQAKLTEDELFGSSATEQFQSMSDAKLADSMAGTGGFGIADMLLKQFGGKVAANAPAAKEPGK